MIMNFEQITGQVIIQSFISNDGESISFYGMNLQQALLDIATNLNNQIFSIQYHLLSHKYYDLGLTEEHRLVNRKIVEFKVLVKKLIEERIREETEYSKKGIESPKKDLIHYLKTNNYLEEINTDIIVDEFILFFLAGMGTTGHLCGMIVYYLTQYPAVKERLLRELKENTDDSH